MYKGILAFVVNMARCIDSNVLHSHGDARCKA